MNNDKINRLCAEIRKIARTLPAGTRNKICNRCDKIQSEARKQKRIIEITII